MIDQSDEARDVKYSLDQLFREARRREELFLTGLELSQTLEQCREGQSLICAIDLLVKKAKGIEYDRDDLHGRIRQAVENARYQEKLADDRYEQIRKLERESERLRVEVDRLKEASNAAR